MKRIIILVCLVLWVIPPVAGRAETPDYRLGPGDGIKLSIWTNGNEPVVTKETEIRPDGRMALALTLNDTINYRLGAGDSLEISVWGYEELHVPQLVIRPDGKFAFPSVGEVRAEGLTPFELTQTLAKSLSSYVIQPQVTVNVVKFRTIPWVREFGVKDLTLKQLIAVIAGELQKQVAEARVTAEIIKFRKTRVYVLGEVAKPGLCEIEKNHRVLDALSAAGGFTHGANKQKLYLVRQQDPQQYTLVNLKQLLKKGDLSQNYLLNEGDLLFMARRKTDYLRDVLPFITAIYQLREM